MSSPRSKSNAQIAHDNELAILRAVRLFGHLRRVELARACWPNSSVESASACAWRAIARMIKNGDIVARANNLGGQSVMLTKRGADRLLDIGLEAPLSLEAAAPALRQFWHRTLATRYLIERIEPGAGVLGEYALYQSWSPIKREHLAERYAKLPDGLVFVPGASRGYNTPGQKAVDWIEVEAADKSTRELANIFQVTKYAEQLLPHQAGIVLDRVCIVYDASAMHEFRILSALQQFLQRNPEFEDSVSHNLYLVRCYVRRPLIWERCEQIPCAALLKDFRRTGRTEITPPPEDPLSGQLRANP